VQQLQHFAFGDGIGGVGEDLHHLDPLQLDHQLEAARVEEVADQHAGGVAEHGIGGLAAPAQVGLVDHVVMEQGGGVDELDHGGQLPGIAALVAQCAGREQEQHGPEALAAAGDDVLGHLVDQDHVRAQATADQGIHGGHVRGGQGQDGGQVERGGHRSGFHGGSRRAKRTL